MTSPFAFFSKFSLLLLGCTALGGCGGTTISSNSSPWTTPTQPSPPQPGPGVSFATGSVVEAVAGAPGPFDTILAAPNTLAPQTILYSGNTDPSHVTYSSDLTFVSAGGRNFSFVQGSDDASFALIGIPNNNAGSYIYADTAAPTSGTAIFRGDYFGRHNGAAITVANPFIEGDTEISVNFAADTFNGTISNRSVVTGSGTVNANAFWEDVNFSGDVSSTGIMQGTHVDANSLGIVNAIAFSDGAVGTVEIVHGEGRLPLYPGASTCGFGNFASCSLIETGVFAVD